MRGETDEMMTEAASEIGAAVTEMTGGPVEDGKTTGTETEEEGEGFVMTIERAGGSRGGVETLRRGVRGTQQTGRGERRSTPGCRAWLA